MQGRQALAQARHDRLDDPNIGRAFPLRATAQLDATAPLGLFPQRFEQQAGLIDHPLPRRSARLPIGFEPAPQIPR